MRYLIPAAALALATAAQATPPPAEGWTELSDDADATVYIRDKDWTAGRPESESVLVWVWLDQKRTRGVSHTTMLVEINCPSEGYRLVKITDFSTAGKATDKGSSVWEYSTPGTIIGEIVRTTCMEPQGDFW